MEDRAGEATSGRSDTGAALAMLSAFASVGAKVFDLSITDSDGKPVKGLQRLGMSLGEMRGRITRVLQDAERHRHNVIIRPRSATALLIQLDDCDDEKAKRLELYSFLTFRTSPGNYQVWLAVASSSHSFGPSATQRRSHDTRLLETDIPRRRNRCRHRSRPGLEAVATHDRRQGH